MKNTYFIFIFLVSIVFGCRSDKNLTKIDLNSIVKQKCILLNKSAQDSINLNLCSMIPLKWDSIIVLTPYIPIAKLRELPLKNSNLLSSFYKELDDTSLTLLYIHKNQILGYSIYTRDIDIIAISQKKYYGHMIVTKDQCNYLFIKKDTTGQDKYIITYSNESKET